MSTCHRRVYEQNLFKSKTSYTVATMTTRWEILSFFFATVIVASVSATDHDGIVIRMPDVKPLKHDTYLCTGLKLPDTPSQVIGYEPLAKMDTAHHMLLYSCGDPGNTAPAWNCGEMGGGSTGDGYPSGGVCSSGFKLIYAWAMDAPSLGLPEGVAFKLPAGDTLVLQVHYNKVDKFKKGATDNSGIRLSTTTEHMPKSAAVYLLGTAGTVPKYQVTYLETACPMQLPKDKEMYPFAFRTHTHKHGRVVSGYRVRNGEWTEVGRGNPRRPQMFYNVTGPNGITIRNGDYVAARCTMFNRHNINVHIGSTGNDEMCNFYMMFWVHGEMPDTRTQCWGSGSAYDDWSTIPQIHALNKAPLELSEQPHLGPNEEEVVNDPPAAADARDKRGTLSEDDPNFVLSTDTGGRFYMDANVYKALGLDSK